MTSAFGANLLPTGAMSTLKQGANMNTSTAVLKIAMHLWMADAVSPLLRLCVVPDTTLRCFTSFRNPQMDPHMRCTVYIRVDSMADAKIVAPSM
eukprot:2949401-Amphidinium_carterae.1